MKERALLIACVLAVGGVVLYNTARGPWTSDSGDEREPSLLAITENAGTREVAAAQSAAESQSPAPSVSRPPSAERPGEDWPNFLGPNQNGKSDETGLLETWPEEGPEALWVRQVGNAYSPPTAAQGRVVFFHRLRGEEIIECADALTGKTIWTHSYPSSYVDRYGYNNGPRCSPLIEGGRIYAFGAEGTLTCLDFETGQRLWQRFLNREYNVPQNFFGVGASPIVEGDLVLINLGGPGGAGLAALDKLTGNTVWTASDDGASYSTPVIFPIRGERLAIFFTQDGLLTAEPATGVIRHRYPFRSRIRESVNAASPVVLGDRVFLSATYNTGSVLLELGPGGATEVWKDRRAMQNHWATSIYHEGYLYGMDGRHETGSNFRCIEFETGKVMWTADEGLGRASFIMADGRLIALGERGHLALIEVSPERYIERSRVRALRYPCWTPPILSRGLLYIRNENVLACLDLRAGQ